MRRYEITVTYRLDYDEELESKEFNQLFESPEQADWDELLEALLDGTHTIRVAGALQRQVTVKRVS